MRRHVSDFDYRLTRAIQALPPGAGKTLAYLTHAGSEKVAVGWFCGLFIAGLFARDAQLIALATGGLVASGSLSAIKRLFRRQRPDNDFAATLRGWSFPSGHSAHSLLAYGTLTALAARAGWGSWVGWASGLMVGLIGISRVYLGAHFPSDVVGAWVLSAGCLLAVLKVAGLL
jgi:membrane-associated phospholipid phosphatase